MKKHTAITLSSNANIYKDQYIKVVYGERKMFGKVIDVISDTTMTVQWVPSRQWFWIAFGLLCKRLANSLRLHLAAFGEYIRGKQ
jgi:hypothetical protein